MEEFLKTAKSKNLLLNTEISKRKKENRLTLVKKLVLSGSKSVKLYHTLKMPLKLKSHKILKSIYCFLLE